MGLGARVVFGLLAVAAAGVAVFYAFRVPLAAPLYGGAEGGQLIRALYGPTLAARPDLFPELMDRHELLYGLVVRALTYATHDLAPWLRVGGALAYFGGLALVFLSVRPALKPSPALAALLLALAYPYYRFAASVTPAGWCVGLIGLCVFLTARLYFKRPMIHALAAGAVCGLASVLAPQGLALAAALLLLAVADLGLGRRHFGVFAGRVTLSAAAFLVSVNLVQLAANRPAEAPLSFFLDPRYAALAASASPETLMTGARAMVAMTAASLALAGVPLLTGLLRVEMRWRWTRARGRFHLEPLETAFLLLAGAFVLGLASTAALAAADHADPSRLWGRQFEFFIPLLWLVAAPFVGEFERGAGRWWRLATGAVTLAGLAALVACLLTGAQAKAWDDAALGALARDGTAAFPLAVVVIAAAVGASAFTDWPVMRTWIAGFVLLGVISTAADAAWQRGQAEARATFDAEARAAEALIARRPGVVAVAAPDAARARLLFWRLRARPQAVLIGPAIKARRLDADLVVAHRGARLGPGWRPLLQGREVSVFAPSPTTAAAVRPQAAEGGGLGSGPGSG